MLLQYSSEEELGRSLADFDHSTWEQILCTQGGWYQYCQRQGDSHYWQGM